MNKILIISSLIPSLFIGLYKPMDISIESDYVEAYRIAKTYNYNFDNSYYATKKIYNVKNFEVNRFNDKINQELQIVSYERGCTFEVKYYYSTIDDEVALEKTYFFESLSLGSSTNYFKFYLRQENDKFSKNEVYFKYDITCIKTKSKEFVSNQVIDFTISKEYAVYNQTEPSRRLYLDFEYEAETNKGVGYTRIGDFEFTSLIDNKRIYQEYDSISPEFLRFRTSFSTVAMVPLLMVESVNGMYDDFILPTEDKARFVMRFKALDKVERLFYCQLHTPDHNGTQCIYYDSVTNKLLKNPNKNTTLINSIYLPLDEKLPSINCALKIIGIGEENISIIWPFTIYFEVVEDKVIYIVEETLNKVTDNDFLGD